MVGLKRPEFIERIREFSKELNLPACKHIKSRENKFNFFCNYVLKHSQRAKLAIANVSMS
jgi:hypothetical protein